MSEDRVARRNRNSPRGLLFLAVLALAAAALILAAWLKEGAADQRARRHIETENASASEKSSTVSPDRTQAEPLPVK